MIRVSKEEDFGVILDMCSEFWENTQFDEPFDRDHTQLMVEFSHDQRMMAVLEIEGEVEGFIAAVYSLSLGSPLAKTSTDLGWWVNKSRRNGGYGVQLVEFLECLAVEQDVKYFNMAFMETSMPAVVKKMYESMGFTLQETTFTKVLNGSNNNRRNRSGCELKRE